MLPRSPIPNGVVLDFGNVDKNFCGRIFNWHRL